MTTRRYEQHQCCSCGRISPLVALRELPIGWAHVPEMFIGDEPPASPTRMEDVSLCPDCSPVEALAEGALFAKRTGESLRG